MVTKSENPFTNPKSCSECTVIKKKKQFSSASQQQHSLPNKFQITQGTLISLNFSEKFPSTVPSIPPMANSKGGGVEGWAALPFAHTTESDFLLIHTKPHSLNTNGM